ncbi:B12-binding domain-containing radical SAM protein [Candidatus Woesearchaeota archaeon]|nr:B12-binding domain-containing radical SAM protein [Candidatus Woesearchaeota archaeon]
MKVLLINPPQVSTKSQVTGGVVPPLGLAYLAAVLYEQGYSVKIIDALGEDPYKFSSWGPYRIRGLPFEKIVQKIDPDTELVGISNMYSFAFILVQHLIDLIKRELPNIQIVLGGAHATVMPQYVLKNTKADFVVLGEGEKNILEICSTLKKKVLPTKIKGLAFRNKNKVIVNEGRNLVEDINTIPIPKRDLLPMENYFELREPHGAAREKRWTTMISSRGCPYKCSFCNTPYIWQGLWRSRNPKLVVDEIETLAHSYRIKEIHFEDESMVMNRNKTLEFCRELKARKLDIIWQPSNGIRAELANLKLLSAMKHSGCTHITFAPESGSKRVLNQIINKNLNLNAITSAVRNASQLGIKTMAYFVIGLPGETPVDIKESIRYANKLARLGLDETDFSVFSPLPGSQLFFELEKQGKIRLDPKFFFELLAMGDVSFAKSWSEHISDEQLKKLRLCALLEFHANKALFHPLKVIKSLYNISRGVQELKTERALTTFFRRHIRR